MTQGSHPASPRDALHARGSAADSELDELHTFRRVPRTGVIYVMTEAQRLGYSYGDGTWANLGQGAPETGPLDDAPDRLASIEVEVASQEYGPVPGLSDLREAVAELYNHRYRRGMASRYTAENVAISSGGRLALSRLAASLGRTHIGHFLPDYTAYEELLEIFEMFSPIPIPLDPEAGYNLSPRQLENEIVGRGLGAVLFSNPSNPTGRLTSGPQLDRWVDVARRHRAYLLIDEFYSHYVWDGALPDRGGVSAAEFVVDVDRDPVVLLDGLTKNWRYPGFRIGWTVGPRHVIEAVSAVGSFLDGGAPHPIQRAAIPLLAPEVADREAAAIRQAFRPKRDYLIQSLRELGVSIDHAPSGAFYVWGSVAGLPDGLSTGREFFRRALDHRTIVVPGEFFDVNPGKRRHAGDSRFDRHVRFSFGPDMPALQRGIAGLRTMLDEAR